MAPIGALRCSRAAARRSGNGGSALGVDGARFRRRCILALQVHRLCRSRDTTVRQSWDCGRARRWRDPVGCQEGHRNFRGAIDRT
jgi:hypothetical protein